MSLPRAAVQVRPVAEEELGAWVRQITRSFHVGRRVTAEDLAQRRRRFTGQRLTGAYAGTDLVGTFRTWPLSLPVPGATAPAEAVSSVTVAATARRRGVLTAMMDAELVAAKERGAALAVLIASEAPIYGRFGYGPATEACRWVLDSAAARFRHDPTADGDVVLELVEDADLRSPAPGVYAAAAAGMPGAMTRDDVWWDTVLGVVPVPGEDADRARLGVLARDAAGRAVGYARYRVEESSVQRRETSTVVVDDLAATTPAAHSALWRALADIDLTTTVRAEHRPVHEPLPWLLADRRVAAQSDRADFQWVRLLDLPAALSARRYATTGTAVLDVVDADGLAGGRVRLDVDDAGRGQVALSDAEPDVVLDVAALGSAYLGQVPLAELRASGLVQEQAPGALARLSALLSWHPATSVGHTWF